MVGSLISGNEGAPAQPMKQEGAFPTKRPEFVELFCGIGGFAASIRDLAKVKIAVDISEKALDVYRLNFSHLMLCKTIESLTVEQTESWSESSWWLSPPCQPFTRRGKQADLDDPRCQAFLNVLRLIDEHRPPEIALENVPEFENSRAFDRLKNLLCDAGYSFQFRTICPTQMGFRNRRLRFYLVAAKKRLNEWRDLPSETQRHTESTSHIDLKQLWLNREDEQNYLDAIDLVELSDQTACFTSAYGRSVVRSGSYMRTADGIRRFSPAEILDQLGFDSDFRLPDEPYKRLWPLVGNSVSIPVVRYVTSHLPSLCPQTCRNSTP